MTTNAVKADEYFFGELKHCEFHKWKWITIVNWIATTLDKAGASSTWQPLQWDPVQRLAIRQLMLAHTAKENEFNVIEVSQNVKNERKMSTNLNNWTFRGIGWGTICKRFDKNSDCSP